MQRCSAYADAGGSYALVTPQNWLFLGTYKKLRERLLKTQSWNLVARLGAQGFRDDRRRGRQRAMFALTNAPPAGDHPMSGLDVSDRKTPAEKDRALREAEVGDAPAGRAVGEP